MRVTYRDAARTDLIRQFRYYLVMRNLPEIALRFREAVRRTANEISVRPNIATPVRLKNPTLTNLRSWPVDGFRAIRIYFLANGDSLQILRILHGKQDVRRILEKDHAGDAS